MAGPYLTCEICPNTRGGVSAQETMSSAVDANALARHSWRTMRRLLAALVVIAGLGAGCTSTPKPEPATLEVPSAQLDASVAQFRFDEGTRNLRAGVTNNSERDIRVSAATIAWDGFRFPKVQIADDLVKPGLTAAFDIAYGAPRCSREPTGKPALVAVVDGLTRRLPLRVDDPELLVRLRDSACAAERLNAAATVRLSFEPTTVTVHGEEYLPGRVMIARRTGDAEPIRVVDLGGSVLVDFVARNGRRSLPVTLAANQRQFVLPVLAGSAHRCDGHARGNSSQTFLLSVYLRLGDAPVQRRILIPAAPDQVRVLAVIDRDCR